MNQSGMEFWKVLKVIAFYWLDILQSRNIDIIHNIKWLSIVASDVLNHRTNSVPLDMLRKRIHQRRSSLEQNVARESENMGESVQDPMLRKSLRKQETLFQFSSECQVL